ncbi:hypothetical protein E4T49_01760 [Aureobasidium sp. EXF-10728]|nr:hypothetical protein E4T49_01760 [Aureobasidium sp. EXF-10728]
MLAKYSLASSIAALVVVVYAQNDVVQIPTIYDRVNTPFTFTDCAAPKEMQTCWEAQNYTAEYLDNECTGLQNRIDCALTNCWNKVSYSPVRQYYDVYSCDYQQLLLAYNVTCSEDHGTPNTTVSASSALELPFYPPPAGAAGECSCNLSTVDDSIQNGAFENYLACETKVRKENGETDDDSDYSEAPVPDCACCLYGSVAAALWDTCPSQDPAYIALATIKQIYIDSDRNGNNNSLAHCASRLASGNFSCVDYGFSTYGKNASEYAKPTPLHSATGTWSDVNGILTSPVSGAIYTWTAWNTTFTNTAVSVEAVATRTADASQQITGSVTGTAIGGSSTSTGGAAPTLNAVQRPAAALLGLGGIALALL